MSEKEWPEKFDIMQHPIEMDSIVAYAKNNNLRIGRVIKITEKMIRILPVQSKYSDLRYPRDIYVIPSKEATYYLLTLK